METNHEVNRLNPHEAEVLSCAWSRDGQKIMSGSRDHKLVIGDAATGETTSLFIANGDVCAIATLLDESRLVIGDNAGTIYLLQVHGWQPKGPVITAWRSPKPAPSQSWSENSIDFGCPHCRTWAEVSESALDTEIACPHCGRQVRLNPFVIDADWHPVAAAWKGDG
jgi:WD40 repeat protein